MYWSKDAGAEGMCLGPQDMDEITMIYDSFAEQQDDGNSIYWYVKEALRLRNAYPEISHGTASFLKICRMTQCACCARAGRIPR